MPLVPPAKAYAIGVTIQPTTCGGKIQEKFVLKVRAAALRLV